MQSNVPSGLSSEEVIHLHEQYGSNLIEEKKKSWIRKLWHWVYSPMSVMFIVAGALSFVSGSTADAIIIISLFVVNVGVGVWHEAKADTAIDELKKKLLVMVKTCRDGEWKKVPSTDLVPGDIIELSTGDVIPADIHFVSGVNISVNESTVTGESLPKQKDADDIAYSGTFMSTGLAMAQVTAIGNKTYFGQTMNLVEGARKRSTLEKDIISVSKFLSVMSMILMLIMMIVLWYAGRSLLEIATLDVSMLIAGIPVALPTVMTLIISVGVVALAKKAVIVRRLSSLEDLANVNLLLSDKTGTLTENNIQVEKMVPLIMTVPHSSGMTEEEIWSLAVACSPRAETNPLDTAIIAKAQQLHVSGKPIINFIPGDSERKRTTVFFDEGGKRRVATLGAPMTIASLSSFGIASNRNAGPVSEAYYSRIVKEAATEGFRVLALAMGDTDKEENMKPLAVFYLADAVRPEAKDAIAFMSEYGITTKMVTGDGYDVAGHVAGVLGLSGRIVKRTELESNKEDLKKEFSSFGGFAEVLPKDKYDIVMMAQKSYTVAVTGDGVNDVPPIKAANVGIAVANAVDALKGTADIVLTLPGIAVIKDAIIEARKIFARLYNYSVYRISESFRLIVTVAVIGVIFGTYPLTPVMIILIALLNDVPIISLAYDRVPVSLAPARINVRQRLTLSTLFGLTGVINSLLLLWISYYFLHLPWAIIQTLFFLKLTIGGHMLVYVAHTDKPWWRYLPSKQVLWATSITQILATILAVTGIFVPAIPIGYAVAVWVWAFFWMQISEGIKQIYQGMLV